MKSVVSQKPWLKDPLAVRKQWNEEEYSLVEHGHGKNLCFGILWDDGDVMPHPPVRRGLEEAKKALIAAGHKGQDSFLLFCYSYIFVIVIDWKPLKHMEICKVLVSVPSRINLNYDYTPFLFSFLPITECDMFSRRQGGLPRRHSAIWRTCYRIHESSD